MNKIYLLRTRDCVKVVYDSYEGHVIIAKTHDKARLLCPHADEGDIWKDNKLTSIKYIGKTYLKEQVLLSDFNAG